MANKHIVYEFKVTATLPLTDDPQHPDFYTEAVATAPKFRYALEKTMHALLRRFEAECDCEIVDFSVEDDDPHGASCGCEDCSIERARDTSEEGLG
jgi:hypothetical protein